MLGKSTAKIYFKNLDALRTLAFLSVFFYHCFHTTNTDLKRDVTYGLVTGFFSNGDLGVNFFFVLSGFLITYLLFVEYHQKSRISIGKFYARRILRIWPVYFIIVLFGFLVFPYFKALFEHDLNETADPLLFILFLSNFNNIFNGMPDASILGVLWSVAIEEQYYLFWPIILVLFRHRIYLVSFILIGISVLFRYHNQTNELVLYFHTLSVLPNLIIGSIFGMLISKTDRIASFFIALEKGWHWIFYFTFLLTLVSREFFRQNILLNSMENVIFSFFFIWIILEQVYAKKSLFKIGRITILESSGKYTYGLYCYHFIGILISYNLRILLGIEDSLFTVFIIDTSFALAVAYLVAYLSYNVLEKPLLKLKAIYLS